jgi:hypothetical protein
MLFAVAGHWDISLIQTLQDINQFTSRWTFDPNMRSRKEVIFAPGGDHRYRYRGRNRSRYRLLQTHTTDCDCDSDPDSDTDGYRVPLSF